MPDLRIVPTESIFAHEEHDFQRSTPLIERLRSETVLVNPPLVAAGSDQRYVVLDGANRTFAFSALGYPHILVHNIEPASGLLTVATWHHVVCDMPADTLFERLDDAQDLQVAEHGGEHPLPAAVIDTRSGQRRYVLPAGAGLPGLNAALRRLVTVYRAGGVLQRTTLEEVHEIWDLHPSASAIVRFRPYSSAEILQSALSGDLLPAGVSRHIAEGRALKVNYPLALLRDISRSLADKNDALRSWIREKTARRQVRFYAESTYQFDE